jgi:hypothetical protein
MPPQAPRASGRLHLRFEDVTRDGRLVLESLPSALGPTVWRAFLESVFEEAALRRFVELGRGSKVLCRHIDIAYRKPCFAGQTMRVVQQAFEDDGRLGVAAVLVDASAAEGADARPHVYARLTF